MVHRIKSGSTDMFCGKECLVINVSFLRRDVEGWAEIPSLCTSNVCFDEEMVRCG